MGDRIETNEQRAPDRAPGRQVREYRPGFRRPGFGGFMLALASALTPGSLLRAVIGSGAWAGRRPGSGVVDLFRRGE